MKTVGLSFGFTFPPIAALSALAAFTALLTGTACAQYSVQIDIGEQKAYLLYDDRAIMESPISSGRYGHLTPNGTFTITDKDLNHTSSIYGRIVDEYGRTVVSDADVDMPVDYGTRFVNAPMRYYMQFAPGIGMHAGYLPGYPASHGCVRMPESKAIAFFQAISVGTPVTVFGTTPRDRVYQVNNPGRQFGPSYQSQMQQQQQQQRRPWWRFFGF
jgi:lipoprotein-anchoring transpeptidase ErfK/SrfK